MARLSEEQIRWFRLRRSGLVEPFASPEAAAAGLAGVQAQILTAALLALWNRSAPGRDGEAEVAARLFDARTLLRLWGQRHTLHLYAREDWPTVNAAFAGRRTWWERQARSRPGAGPRRVPRGRGARRRTPARTRHAQPQGTACLGDPVAGGAAFAVGRGVRGTRAARARRATRAGTAARRATPIAPTGCRISRGSRRPRTRPTPISRGVFFAATARRARGISPTGAARRLAGGMARALSRQLRGTGRGGDARGRRRSACARIDLPNSSRRRPSARRGRCGCWGGSTRSCSRTRSRIGSSPPPYYYARLASGRAHRGGGARTRPRGRDVALRPARRGEPVGPGISRSGAAARVRRQGGAAAGEGGGALFRTEARRW